MSRSGIILGLLKINRNGGKCRRAYSSKTYMSSTSTVADLGAEKPTVAALNGSSWSRRRLIFGFAFAVAGYSVYASGSPEVLEAKEKAQLNEAFAIKESPTTKAPSQSAISSARSDASAVTVSPMAKANAPPETVNHTAQDDSSWSSTIWKGLGMLCSAIIFVPVKLIEVNSSLESLWRKTCFDIIEPSAERLLQDLGPPHQHDLTLVLDLNETLMYCDYEPGGRLDKGLSFSIRPGVHDFLDNMSEYYEIIVYSDHMGVVVNGICEFLDPYRHHIRHRLSKGAAMYKDGKYYRDLSKLKRDPAKIIYVSAHAFESCLQPENCVPVKPYKPVKSHKVADEALFQLMPFLKYVACNHQADVRTVLKSYERKDVAEEFARRHPFAFFRYK